MKKQKEIMIWAIVFTSMFILFAPLSFAKGPGKSSGSSDGFCCKSGLVSSSSKSKCLQQGGSWYPSQFSAKSNCKPDTEYCCSNGKVSAVSPDKCKKYGGKSYASKTSAVKVCQDRDIYCCLNGDVDKMSPTMCKNKGGKGYTSKTMAQRACEPEEIYCCRDGNVEKISPKRCKAIRGIIYDNRAEASRSCRPKDIYCCLDGNVYTVSAEECKAKKGGDGYKSRSLALRNCGWCCDGNRVFPASAGECRMKRGEFASSRSQAERECRSLTGYCNVRGQTLEVTQEKCDRLNGRFFSNLAHARAGLLKNRQGVVKNRPSTPPEEESTQSPKETHSSNILSKARIPSFPETAKSGQKASDSIKTRTPRPLSITEEGVSINEEVRRHERLKERLINVLGQTTPLPEGVDTGKVPGREGDPTKNPALRPQPARNTQRTESQTPQQDGGSQPGGGNGGRNDAWGGLQERINNALGSKHITGVEVTPQGRVNVSLSDGWTYKVTNDGNLVPLYNNKDNDNSGGGDGKGGGKGDKGDKSAAPAPPETTEGPVNEDETPKKDPEPEGGDPDELRSPAEYTAVKRGDGGGGIRGGKETGLPRQTPSESLREQWNRPHNSGKGNVNPEDVPKPNELEGVNLNDILRGEANQPADPGDGTGDDGPVGPKASRNQARIPLRTGEASQVPEDEDPEDPSPGTGKFLMPGRGAAASPAEPGEPGGIDPDDPRASDGQGNTGIPKSSKPPQTNLQPRSYLAPGRTASLEKALSRPLKSGQKASDSIKTQTPLPLSQQEVSSPANKKDFKQRPDLIPYSFKKDIGKYQDPNVDPGKFPGRGGDPAGFDPLGALHRAYRWWHNGDTLPSGPEVRPVGPGDVVYDLDRAIEWVQEKINGNDDGWVSGTEPYEGDNKGGDKGNDKTDNKHDDKADDYDKPKEEVSSKPTDGEKLPEKDPNPEGGDPDELRALLKELLDIREKIQLATAVNRDDGNRSGSLTG